MKMVRAFGAFGLALTVAVMASPSHSLAQLGGYGDPSWARTALSDKAVTEDLPPEPRKARAKLTVIESPASVDAGSSVTLVGSSTGLRSGTRISLETKPTDGKPISVSRGAILANGSWTLTVKEVPLGKTAYRVVAVASGRVAATLDVAITGYAWAPLWQVTTSRTNNGQYVIDGRVFPTQLSGGGLTRLRTLLPGPLSVPAGCKSVELGGGFDDGGDGTMTVFAGTDAETFLRVEVPGASGAIGMADVPKQTAFTVIATDVSWTRWNMQGTSIAYAGGRAYCSFTLR